MTWRQKALLQHLVAMLPRRLSYAAHYYLQRRSGGLRGVDERHRLQAGLDLIECIAASGRPAAGGTFLEVGTGDHINTPLVLWLAGAARITTVDLNPYLRGDLVISELAYVREHLDETRSLFRKTPGGALNEDRLAHLGRLALKFPSLLDELSTRYIAPADAARVPLPDGCIDFHISYAVLQHIPPQTLRGILLEARRLLKPGGLGIHWIDMSDHFSHGDHSISPVNFLQFSDREWRKLAGNRFMYQNRMRVDDYIMLLGEIGATVRCVDAHVNERALRALADGLRLDPQFAGKEMRTNATTNAWITFSF